MFSPQKTLCQSENNSLTVVAPDKTEIDRELTPILAELMTLGPGNDHHPAVRHLFNWLVNPQRIGEEFTYVIGELVCEVCIIMQGNFLGYLYDEDYCTCLCKVAAESLAMKCPVLEGSWEQAAWALVVLVDYKDNSSDEEYSVASNRLCAWIIHVIGDPDICPNPCLRYELMILLTKKVDIDGCIRTQAIESVLSACSSLNIEYLSVNILEYHQTHVVESVLSTLTTSNNDYQSANLLEFRQIEFDGISNIFKMLSKDGCLLDFDKKLSKELLEVKSSRCSSIVSDVGYCFAVNPNRFTEPRPLYGLMALFKTLNGNLVQFYKEILKEGYLMFSTLMKLQKCSEVLYALISHFKASCQTPILSDLVKSCIIYILEIVIRINVHMLNDDDDFHQSIYKNIVKMLAKLLGDLPIILVALTTSANHSRLTNILTNINLYLETFQDL